VGEGKIDFKPIFQKLIDINFTGTLNIELPRSNADRLLSKQRLEPILKELGVL
jgi:sugar phosphate isomerase/epimerase